ncbi:hypothetical protein CBW46_015035 [Paenibacillus xerothermodurans]|uniref:DUF3923 family protein n=1 Tax=Paenibacillus xerothermodurans TaxID=1977292 RepID=A0A2W1N8M8_PAEXE|nr:hypothetical protein CBW46_015035 [Paenibacillus xerothermodurans]
MIKISISYKLAFVLVIIWFVVIVYGFHNFDTALSQDAKFAYILVLAALGIIFFPILFLIIFFVRRLKDRKKT